MKSLKSVVGRFSLCTKALLSVVLLVLASCASAAEPRGIRTNNPGNLVKTNITWQGEVQCDDKVNECFESPYYGIRAMVKVLHTYYYKHNLTTLDQIMARFSEFSGAAKGVSAISGIDRTAVIKLHDIGEMVNLSKAIIVQENGKNPYPDQLIRQVLYDTYGVDHFRSVSGSVLSPETYEQEAGHGEGQARDDDAGSVQEYGGEETDKRERESRVRVHTPDDSFVVCVCGGGVAEIGSTPDALGSRDTWVDRIYGWVLAFLGRERTPSMARGSGVCHYTP